MNDIRFALRSLAKAPGVTLLTLITIALGIGACSAIFTVVNSVLLRPVDYPQSESLMVIRQNKLPQFPTFSICPADFLDFQREGDRFESMYAQRGRSYILTGGGQPQRLQGSSATASMFATLRVQPALGRAFTTEEDVPGKNHVVVISHAFWQSQFGGRADVLGQSLLLNGTPHAVIGVMPESFRQGSKFDVLTPIAFTAEQKVDRGGHYVSAVGRLKPGVTVEEADAQLKAIAAQLAQTYPDGNEGWSAYIVPMLEWNTGSLRPTLFTLLGAVGFLLLIACANVGNLQLARATARRREITVRAALGASSTRIVRLLLTESVILGVAGGVLGLLIANWSLDGLLALGGNQIPRAAEVGLDGRVVVFTLGLSLLTGLAFGLVPAWQCRRLDLVDAMKSGARGGGDASRHRLRNGLVVAEIALALVMLAGAGLLGRSFVRLAAADPGFESHDAWWVSVGLPRERYDSNEKLVAFTNAVEERFRALPGVADVGTTMVMPFSNNDYVLALSFPDREFSAAESPSTNYSIATPGYFSTMRIPLKQGRTFTDADRAGAPRVAVVSETFVERMFPQTNPLGQRVNVGDLENPTWREIVGVVGDVKQFGLDQSPAMQFYEPLAQNPDGFLSFVVRTSQSGSGALLAKSLREAVYAVDADQPVFHLRAVDDLVADSVAQRKFALILLGIFSGLALLLAAIGIYGVMAFAVAQRTSEFGLRMALGAQSGDVLRLVLVGGVRLIALGIGIGLVGALSAGGLIASQLHDTASRDPLVLSLIALLLAAVALLACLLPARRATRVDPMVALRTE